MRRVRHELILGGTKSGKSRLAESRASDWLAVDGDRCATLVATALPGDVTGDEEMAQRIARHRADRAARIPALQTVEAPALLGRTLRRLAEPRRLIVVDCLTLWLLQCLTAADGGTNPDIGWEQERKELIEALRGSPSPVILVSNEISLGVTPIGATTRAFVDALGLLHQAVAGQCARLTLMVAGQALAVKDAP